MTPDETMRILIVDDEPLARRNLRLVLEGTPGVEIAGESASGEEALEFLQRSAPDLILLDIQMPGIDGLEVARAIAREHTADVVFVTAYSEHAVAAFEAEAIDYLLKPIEAKRVRESVERARRRLDARSRADLGRRLEALLRSRARPEPQPWFILKEGVRQVRVRPSEIRWLEAQDYCVKVHLED